MISKGLKNSCYRNVTLGDLLGRKLIAAVITGSVGAASDAATLNGKCVDIVVSSIPSRLVLKTAPTGRGVDEFGREIISDTDSRIEDALRQIGRGSIFFGYRELEELVVEAEKALDSVYLGSCYRIDFVLSSMLFLNTLRQTGVIKPSLSIDEVCELKVLPLSVLANKIIPIKNRKLTLPKNITFHRGGLSSELLLRLVVIALSGRLRRCAVSGAAVSIVERAVVVLQNKFINTTISSLPHHLGEALDDVATQLGSLLVLPNGNPIGGIGSIKAIVEEAQVHAIYNLYSDFLAQIHGFMGIARSPIEYFKVDLTDNIEELMFRGDFLKVGTLPTGATGFKIPSGMGVSTRYPGDKDALTTYKKPVIARGVEHTIHSYDSDVTCPSVASKQDVYIGFELEMFFPDAVDDGDDDDYDPDEDDRTHVDEYANRIYKFCERIKMPIAIKHDGSIEGVGFEVVSLPVPINSINYRKVGELVNYLSDYADVDGSCGLHFHISKAPFFSLASKFFPPSESADDNQKNKVIAITNAYMAVCWFLSKGVFSPDNVGRQSNGYCKPVGIATLLESDFHAEGGMYRDRYMEFSIEPYHTFEVRLFSATLSAREFLTRLRMVRAFSEVCLKRMPQVMAEIKNSGYIPNGLGLKGGPALFSLMLVTVSRLFGIPSKFSKEIFDLVNCGIKDNAHKIALNPHLEGAFESAIVGYKDAMVRALANVDGDPAKEVCLYRHFLSRDYLPASDISMRILELGSHLFSSETATAPTLTVQEEEPVVRPEDPFFPGPVPLGGVRSMEWTHGFSSAPTDTMEVTIPTGELGGWGVQDGWIVTERRALTERLLTGSVLLQGEITPSNEVRSGWTTISVAHQPTAVNISLPYVYSTSPITAPIHLTGEDDEQD